MPDTLCKNAIASSTLENAECGSHDSRLAPSNVQLPYLQVPPPTAPPTAPATTNTHPNFCLKMSDHQYNFNVSMSCGGCSGAVERVLNKLDGVKSFDVKLDSQTANVVTEPSVSYDTVLATIKKTGKAVNSGEADGQKQAV